MFERFTDGARNVLTDASAVAKAERSPAIRRHHMLIGLVDDAVERPEAPVARMLGQFGVDLAAFRTQLLESLRASETARDEAAPKPPFSSGAKKALELALREALSLGHNYIGCEHLFLAILRSADGPLSALLSKSPLEYGAAREYVRAEPQRAGGGRGRRGRSRRHATTEGFDAVLRRAQRRGLGERPATTGDLLVALAEIPGTHFATLVANLSLPNATELMLEADRLIESGAVDGPSAAVRVDPETGSVTVHDPELAAALRGALDQGHPPREALRRMMIQLGLLDEDD